MTKLRLASLAVLSMVLFMFNFLTSRADNLEIGAKAPLFSLSNQDGGTFDLEKRKGSWTVLYFYPKDDTPGCTKQACAFRDSIEDLRKLGAEIYGISKDTVESHKKFADKYNLNFPLLADHSGEVIKQYGVNGLIGLAKRQTFIINPDLVIVDIMRSVDPIANATDVAKKLKNLQSKN